MKQELLEKLKIITEEEKEILSGSNEIDKTLYTDSRSMVIDCKKMLESGQLIQIRPHTRFIYFPKHTHNYVEVIYMCAGVSHHILDGVELTLHAGELLFLSPKVVQEIRPTGLEDIAVNFIVLPEFFDTALSMMGQEENMIREFIVGCLKNEKNPVSYLHFKVSDVLPIQNLLENLIWTIMNRQQNKRSINQITMGLLFLQLMNFTDKIIVGDKNYERELLLTVLRYIEEHYREGNLTELAHELNYDISWLSHMIKKQSGRTYKELLHIKRLNQACYLLSSTRLTVAEVGNAVGYDNLSYFHRIFREKYKVSPKEYRVKERSKM